jgi:F-type H+-transporting ATPase subunit gamma
VPARATDSPPPQLHLPPRRMLLELADQYLFAALNARLLHALMAENHQRVRHLESATRHLDGQWQQLGRRASMLRQEEIIEEIEVILLSAAPGG